MGIQIWKRCHCATRESHQAPPARPPFQPAAGGCHKPVPASEGRVAAVREGNSCEGVEHTWKLEARKEAYPDKMWFCDKTFQRMSVLKMCDGYGGVIVAITGWQKLSTAWCGSPFRILTVMLCTILLFTTTVCVPENMRLYFIYKTFLYHSGRIWLF